MWLNSVSGPAQNRSSSARSWFMIPGLRLDEILGARDSARIAFVSSESGSSTLKR